MNYKDELEKIDKDFDDLSERALKLVLKRAREILQNDPDLNEFVMGMGRNFFTIKEGGKYDGAYMSDEEYEKWVESDDYIRVYNGIIDDDRFHKEFEDMVNDLDDIYHVSGYAVRFTANSEEINHW